MKRPRVLLLCVGLCVLPAAWLSGGEGEAPCSEPILVGDRLVYQEAAAIPRSLTETERRFLEGHPIPAPLGVTPPPEGAVHCAAEYEPMAGVLIAWEGFTEILTQMGALITTVGNADLYVVVDSASEETSALGDLQAGGADMRRVRPFITTTDTVWIRDYGPRYIYEGDCRAVVDHDYNRPRPNDDEFPIFFAAAAGHGYYGIPLIHGGGNYHLDALGNSFTTRLVVNENPTLSEQEIHDLWAAYQNVDTTFFTPYPRSVDSTQHIDMWMQVIGDHAVLISDWPADAGSTQDQLCDAATVNLEARGYTVHRLPARSVNGTHYTYTNSVMCNDLVLIPSYRNAMVAPHNAEALAAWQAALPGKTIVPIDSQDIVGSSGVLHCIVMQVPVPRGGAVPTAYLRNHRACERLAPGAPVDILWLADDDLGVQSVDVYLSTDGAASFPTPLFAGLPNSGLVSWTVPDLRTSEARIRIVAHDADGNTGSDESEENFAIGAPGRTLAPPEPLFVVKQGSDLVLTFPASPGADAYNVYEGRLGAFDLPVTSLCRLSSLNPNFIDNGDGTFSFLLAPGGDQQWYLVSASSCADESILDTALSAGLCGPSR